MPFAKLPLDGSPCPASCDKETTQAFRNSYTKLASSEQAAVDGILGSFDLRPHPTGDTEFPGTQIGTVHVRHDHGYYILYQIFAGRKRPLIKLWYCGISRTAGDRQRYDFEDEPA